MLLKWGMRTYGAWPWIWSWPSPGLWWAARCRLSARSGAWPRSAYITAPSGVKPWAKSRSMPGKWNRRVVTRLSERYHEASPSVGATLQGRCLSWTNAFGGSETLRQLHPQTRSVSNPPRAGEVPNYRSSGRGCRDPVKETFLAQPNCGLGSDCAIKRFRHQFLQSVADHRLTPIAQGTSSSHLCGAANVTEPVPKNRPHAWNRNGKEEFA